jgi:hypothetical protein
MRYRSAYSYRRYANTVLATVATGRDIRREVRRARAFELKVCFIIVIITLALCFFLATNHV